MFKTKTLPTLLGLTLLSASLAASAVTLRIANQGDALSLDPHSLNESLQLSITGNVYEPLVGRDKKLGLTPALATKWAQTSPNVWRFDLRRGAAGHFGTAWKHGHLIDFGLGWNDGSEGRRDGSRCQKHEGKTCKHSGVPPVGPPANGW